MGGRGAGLKNYDGTIAIKFRDGTIYHLRKPDKSRDFFIKVEDGKGHMLRELGSEEWTWGGQETPAEMAKLYGGYSLNAKAVNPKNYINSDQRWKNREVKEKIRKLREYRQSGLKIDWGQENKNYLNNPNFGKKDKYNYKNGKKIVKDRIRKTSAYDALYDAKNKLVYHQQEKAFQQGFTKDKKYIRKHDKEINKLHRKIKSLEKILKQ